MSKNNHLFYLHKDEFLNCFSINMSTDGVICCFLASPRKDVRAPTFWEDWMHPHRITGGRACDRMLMNSGTESLLLTLLNYVMLGILK